MAVSRGGIILSTMVLMSLVDGEIADDEVMRIRWIYERVTGRPLSDADVRTVIDQVAGDDTSLDAYLEHAHAGLSSTDRRLVLKAAFGIASADGKVVDAEDTLLKAVARGLHIPADEYRACISHLMVAREFT